MGTTDRAKAAIVCADYDLNSLNDILLPVNLQHRDIACCLVLNSGIDAEGNRNPMFKHRVEILQTLLKYSTEFNKPSSLLQFLTISMTNYCQKYIKTLDDDDIYAELERDGNYFEARSIFHLFVASSIKESTWRAITDIVLSEHFENVTEKASMSAKEWFEYVFAVARRADSIAVVLLYAKHLLTVQQIDSLSAELKNLPNEEEPKNTEHKYMDQVRIGKTNLEILYDDPEHVYAAGEDYDLMEKLFFDARKKLCEKEVVNTVLGVVGTDLPLYVLQYIVALALPCVDEIFGVRWLTEIILSAQKLRRIKLGLSEESDYAKRLRVDE